MRRECLILLTYLATAALGARRCRPSLSAASNCGWPSGVAAAIEGRETLAVEAGTGTGKTIRISRTRAAFGEREF